jgi:DNA-binding transcriptional LysR family regulator
MNIDDLTYFLAIAETGLLHRAAVQVGVSQPALTKAVRRLENELGVQLFERTPKGMRLNEFGMEFHERAAILHEQHRDALQYISGMRAGEAAVVRVGVTPAAEPLVTKAYLQLIKSRPALRLELNVQLSGSLMQLLEAGNLDITVGPLPLVVPASLFAQPIIEDALWVVTREGHTLQKSRQRITVNDLTGESWILPAPSISARQQITDFFKLHNVDGPTVTIESNYGSSNGVFFLVANTNLLGLCNKQTKVVADNLGLRALEVEGLRLARQLGILTRRRGKLSPLAEVFVQVIASIAQGRDV